MDWSSSPFVPLGLALALLVPTAQLAVLAGAALVEAAASSPSASASLGRPAALVAATALALLVEARLYGRFRLALRARAGGCRPAPVYPHVDPVLGVDVFLETARAIPRGDFMTVLERRFAGGRHTVWNKLMGPWAVLTRDPANIKAVLSSSFDDWAIAGPRLYALLPVLGPHSIFTTNGAEWRHSRAMIRPSFVRDQVADFECFDRHIADLLASIPKAGATFDLQDLLMRMTMDSSTDFL